MRLRYGAFAAALWALGLVTPTGASEAPATGHLRVHAPEQITTPSASVRRPRSLPLASRTAVRVPPPGLLPATAVPTPPYAAGRCRPWWSLTFSFITALTLALPALFRRRAVPGVPILTMAASGPPPPSNDFRSTRVFVQNIPESVSWGTLKDHFAVAGPVAYASVSVDPAGRSKGHGIVQFETVEAATNAIRIMREHPLEGHQLFVREDRQERDVRAPRPGRDWVPGGRSATDRGPSSDRRRPRGWGPPGREVGARQRDSEDRPRWGMLTTTGSEAASPSPIGSEGLRALLSMAAASLGHCRFIVANTASGGILEAVQDFGAVPLRYSPPRETGTFCTLGTPLFECHINIDKVYKIVFARPQRPRSTGVGTYNMYVIRFLDKDDKTALSVLLHSSDFEAEIYDGPACGHPEAWRILLEEYGEVVTVRERE
jgi:hypothetical protein